MDVQFGDTKSAIHTCALSTWVTAFKVPHDSKSGNKGLLKSRNNILAYISLQFLCIKEDPSPMVYYSTLAINCHLQSPCAAEGLSSTTVYLIELKMLKPGETCLKASKL